MAPATFSLRRLTHHLTRWFVLLLASSLLHARAQPSGEPLPGTEPLTWTDDLSAKMVSGIDQFLTRTTAEYKEQRPSFWQRNFSSAEAYARSLATNRAHLAKYIGVIEKRSGVKALEFVGGTDVPAKLLETGRYEVLAVRWPVLEGLTAEGLYVRQKQPPTARVVVLPDADQTPESILGLAGSVPAESQFARKLAEAGCELLIPTLIDRQDTWSGNPRVRFTNQPHREWIYRQAFEMGHHLIGFEVQKVLAACDWFQSSPAAVGPAPASIGVAGYGEGGLVALYAAALDDRLQASWVSGYFQPREDLFDEPIYRNVFALLQEFGDAEIASMVAPRSLNLEFSRGPEVQGPPKPRDGRSGAAPGKLVTPALAAVESEVARTLALLGNRAPLTNSIALFKGTSTEPVAFGSDRSLNGFLAALGSKSEIAASVSTPSAAAKLPDAADRQRRQVKEMENLVQGIMRESDRTRAEFFWNKLAKVTTNQLEAATEPFKKILWEEVIGKFPRTTGPLHPRTRQIYNEPTWTGYDVVLDVWPEVFAWGYLLVPKNLQAGERRPVVVCQHGLEGVPADTINGEGKSGYWAYKSFSARLVEQGYIVYIPHNPYRGETKFRQLQRKANPLKKSLYSVILEQHERSLDFLSGLPFVDPRRIGFYGLSYGGKTAMRVPSLLDRYVLSICSADFNDWIRKNVTVDSPYSYMFNVEYELPEFDLGRTFNYAEMAALIAPRPFMVERGHDDGVAPDEWVAYEFAKVRRFYDRLGLGDKTEIEFFNGPHTINGVATYQFLHRHLSWPEPR